MKTKLFSTSLEKNKDATGLPVQVYGGGRWTETFINKISAGSTSSVLGPDISGNASHLFVPKIDRNFSGKSYGVAGNASDRKEEFSLCYLKCSDIQFFPTIGEKDAFLASQRAQ